MKIGDILYFSPNVRFEDLDLNNKDSLIDAFKDRVYGFYLEPAKKLNEPRYAFARGVLSVSTIDFLALFSSGNNKVGIRFRNWLSENFQDFYDPTPHNKNTYANRFYDEFRNGLIHEGRIKNNGQFLYNGTNSIFSIEANSMVVNPELLLRQLIKAFDHYLDILKKNDSKFDEFKEIFKKKFEKELESIKD